MDRQTYHYKMYTYSNHCPNSAAADQYADARGKQDEWDQAVEALQGKLYEEVEKAAKSHSLLQGFIDHKCEELYEYLHGIAEERLKED